MVTALCFLQGLGTALQRKNNVKLLKHLHKAYVKGERAWFYTCLQVLEINEGKQRTPMSRLEGFDLGPSWDGRLLVCRCGLNPTPFLYLRIAAGIFFVLFFVRNF